MTWKSHFVNMDTLIATKLKALIGRLGSKLPMPQPYAIQEIAFINLAYMVMQSHTM